MPGIPTVADLAASERMPEPDLPATSSRTTSTSPTIPTLRGCWLRTTPQFREAGFQVEAAILAVPAATSRLGIATASSCGPTGTAGLWPLANHDASYTGILTAADQLDRTVPPTWCGVLARRSAAVRPPLTAQGRCAGRGRYRPRGPRRAGPAVDAAETAAFTGRLLEVAADLSPPWHAELVAVMSLARPVATPGSTLAAALEHDTVGVTACCSRNTQPPRRSRRTVMSLRRSAGGLRSGGCTSSRRNAKRVESYSEALRRAIGQTSVDVALARQERPRHCPFRTRR
jgi:hypothetical protein